MKPTGANFNFCILYVIGLLLTKNFIPLYQILCPPREKAKFVAGMRCHLAVLSIGIFLIFSFVCAHDLLESSESPKGQIDCSKKTCLSSGHGKAGPNCILTDSMIIDPAIFYYCTIIPFVRKLVKFEEANMVYMSWELDVLQYVYVALFLLIVLFLLLFFFLILFLCANDHLVPTLSFISAKLALSPSVAGVTLLALGNAAPDLFTSLAGVENVESIPLVISGAIGSGLFITVFVFGIILTKTKPSLPEIRQPGIFGMNILMYFCAICMIALIVFPQRITLVIPVLGFTLYAIYIFFVLWIEKSSISLPSSPSPYDSSRLPSSYRNSILHQSLCSLTLKKLPIDRAEILLASVDNSEHVLSSEATIASHVIDIQDVPPEQVVEKESRIIKVIRNPFKIFVYFFAFLLAISIPPILESSELCNNRQMRRNHQIRIIVCPFFSLCLILTCLRLWSIKTLLFYGIVSTSASVIGYLSIQRIYVNTIKFIIISTILAGLSFAMATFWSWAVSREVISLFSAIPYVLPGFPQSVLGLTVLAWGNSFGDLVVGIALSSMENFELGITGVFSGPVLNVLLSLSISIFKILATNKFQTPQIPAFDTTIYFALGLLASITAISSLFYKYLTSFGKVYGKFLIFLYLCIFIPAVLLNSIIFT